MSWKVRHQGSPESTGELTLAQVSQGLLDGRWEPTDEVKGPEDASWVPLEVHPQFAEVVADLEPPPPRVYDDETRLDMTPLIDVCLVLLIFFILTTTYANLQKIIDAANPSSKKVGGARVITKKQADETMVAVKVLQQGDRSVVEVNGKEVDMKDLVSVFQTYVDQRRRILLLDHDYKVPHDVIVQVRDDAKTAGLDEVLFLVPEGPAKPR
jgi:biopolymer transport protein ExbD